MFAPLRSFFGNCRPWLASAGLSLAACLLAGPSAQAESDGAWVNLLEGNQLSEHWTTTGNWSIDDEGVVRLKPREGESGWTRWDAYLWSKEKYGDFEIKFDYQLQERGNSGFYFRVADKGDPVAQGIEVQIYDSYSKSGDAKLTDHTSGGVIPGVPPSKNTAKPAGEWNQFHIISQDDRLTVKLNGQVVNEIQLDEGALKQRPQTGYIGFQDHGLPLALRNIQIREL